MRRYGERIKKGEKYKTRLSVYGVISVGSNILLTDQDEKEIQLPGGGVDRGELKTHALIREVYEETGWKIQPLQHVGTYQRFVYMPEYKLWAHKICHIYNCKGIYPVTAPREHGHVPLLVSPEIAIKLISSTGDTAFVKKVFKI